MVIEFEEVLEFSSDLKKLSKKFRSLNKDMETFTKALAAVFPGVLPGTKRISDLGKNVKFPVYKVTHFRCSDLKGKGSRSGIRIVYAFRERILQYFGS